jgi:hypothetical protein
VSINKIRQATGKRNAKLTSEQKEVLDKWFKIYFEAEVSEELML